MRNFERFQQSSILLASFSTEAFNYKGHMPWSFPTVIFNINMVTVLKKEKSMVFFPKQNQLFVTLHGKTRKKVMTRARVR